jgi:hypothetical protein
MSHAVQLHAAYQMFWLLGFTKHDDALELAGIHIKLKEMT